MENFKSTPENNESAPKVLCIKRKWADGSITESEFMQRDIILEELKREKEQYPGFEIWMEDIDGKKVEN